MATQSAASFVEQREDDFWVNALIGAVATVLLSWIPLSPILGGGIAGYLQQGTRDEGAKVGAASGLIAAIPVFAVLGLLFGGLSLGILAQGELGGTVLFWGIMTVALLVTAAVAGGMGALGGYLGVVLRERGDDEHEPRSPDPAVEVEAETVH